MSLLFLVGIYVFIAFLMVIAVDHFVGMIYSVSRSPSLIRHDVED